jgi:hypothetical protein
VSNLDLNKLEEKLDNALNNETSESLNEWLKEKRMTNNKQQTAVDASELAMKLYPFSNSERNAFITGYNKAKEMEKEQSSIELPSDEEIREVIKPLANEMDDFDLGFRNGVQWLREKIQGGKQ